MINGILMGGLCNFDWSAVDGHCSFSFHFDQKHQIGERPPEEDQAYHAAEVENIVLRVDLEIADYLIACLKAKGRV